MLRRDKALLENLTRKYGKDFVINEMARGRKSKFTNMLKKYYIFNTWFGKNSDILEELFRLFYVCIKDFSKNIFSDFPPNYEDYNDDEYKEVYINAVETIRDYITEENDWFYSKYFTLHDYISNQPSYPSNYMVTEIIGEMLNVYMHEKYGCFYEEWN